MIALTFGSYAWLSKDYGVNWYKGMFSETDYHIHSTLKADYFAAAISATGQYQMIVSGRSGNADGVVYHSSDYGATFDPAKLPAAVRYLPQHYVSVDNSDSGKIVVVSNTLIAGGLFVSYDYGANFGQITAAPNVTGLVGTQISGNATTMAAYSLSGGPGYIYMSYDYGVHWNQSTAPAGAWIDLAMSQNGQFLLAADYDVALFAYLPYCSAGSVHDGYTAEGVNTCAPCGEGKRFHFCLPYSSTVIRYARLYASPLPLVTAALPQSTLLFSQAPTLKPSELSPVPSAQRGPTPPPQAPTVRQPATTAPIRGTRWVRGTPPAQWCGSTCPPWACCCSSVRCLRCWC